MNVILLDNWGTQALTTNLLQNKFVRVIYKDNKKQFEHRSLETCGANIIYDCRKIRLWLNKTASEARLY